MDAAPQSLLDDVVHHEDGLRAVDRRIFVDPEMFELEQRQIWEKVWVYVAHESQLPKPKDYMTGWIGRAPIVINRDKTGKLNAFVNICSHRGATLCRTSKGNASTFVCSFHGWAYDGQGKLLAAMNEDGAGYPESFDKSKRGLTRVRLENYRGFLFATLNKDAEPLTDYLAEAKTFIDIVVEQSPQGIEILKGRSVYTFEGNWKLQAENGVDGYHVDSVHANYVEMIKNRAKINAEGKALKVMAVGDFNRFRGGYYDLGNGHTMLWSSVSNPQDRPIYGRREELTASMGKEKADWAVHRSRNLGIYPNMFLMDQMGTQIRMFRPLSVDKTEVTIYCFAPIGEPAAERTKRIRQYEDFFNASGMATPDDLTEFNETQKGCNHYSVVRWSDMSRGQVHEVPGADDLAVELGIAPGSSGAKASDEGIFIAQHGRWAELMKATSNGSDR
ncbi:Rieske 2Fe-2S domain-containing protein [Caenimonas sedimenti]|uniref:Rieske 2Fe-2S domain-containing protein n=1 Tax=Caenimonas sedimenti TaxID=2596921 RepID=A0A562ZSF1_9BURK|nr:aromatic ring-hydroxylating dioxygenase subunit alpha [Caenimonas sedimenti]TWO71258.1 Rieske 2Fe-2S domain-containing protein [Caenimonas sedimenti]